MLNAYNFGDNSKSPKMQYSYSNNQNKGKELSPPPTYRQVTAKLPPTANRHTPYIIGVWREGYGAKSEPFFYLCSNKSHPNFIPALKHFGGGLFAGF